MISQSYGYRYLEPPRPELLRLLSIGRQAVKEPDYIWDGMKRGGDGVIFQYTIAGEGRLDMNRQTYRISKGQAFLVSVPSRHRYYYKASGEEAWEFVWVRLAGEQASAFWAEWLAAEGPVTEFRADSETVVKLQSLYESARAGTLTDMWDISIRLYDWLLTLMKRAAEGQGRPQVIPGSYARTAAWMETHYAEDVSLEQLAEMTGVTKHHFCKRFHDYYRMTPIRYLRKNRIEAAAQLLRQSRLPIGEIAERSGFSDLGYFGKVFHKLVGVSPSAYRMTRRAEPGDSLKLL